MSALWAAVVRQFGQPRGPAGVLAGLAMSVRPSNRARTLGTIALLEISPGERVLELGFGPGLGVAAAAALVGRGQVVGVDHSELMLRQASRRNARLIAGGRVDLRLGGAERLPELGAPFDKALAVNVFMFWPEPAGILAGLRRVMRPGGRVALTVQPRRPGAGEADVEQVGGRMAAALAAAGYRSVRVARLGLRPVDAACALGEA